MSRIEDLIAASDNLKEEVQKLTERKIGVDTQVALLMCPFKPGDLIRTIDGLGAKNGLKVMEVVPPANPRDGNRWAMRCFALTKDGSVSARAVNLEHWQESFDQPTLMKED